MCHFAPLGLSCHACHCSACRHQSWVGLLVISPLWKLLWSLPGQERTYRLQRETLEGVWFLMPGAGDFVGCPWFLEGAQILVLKLYFVLQVLF